MVLYTIYGSVPLPYGNSKLSFHVNHHEKIYLLFTVAYVRLDPHVFSVRELTKVVDFLIFYIIV